MAANLPFVYPAKQRLDRAAGAVGPEGAASFSKLVTDMSWFPDNEEILKNYSKLFQ